MTTANINDRHTVERIYTFADYSRDVSENSLGEASVYHGLLIEGAPNPTGDFVIRQHSRGYTEDAVNTGAVFLAPFMGRDYASFYLIGSGKGAVRETGDIFNGDDVERYGLFIDRVIDTARETRWSKPMDPNRLKDSG